MQVLVVGLACIVGVISHPYFRDRIPNGYSVPNPCPPYGIWEPVGHYDPTHHTVQKNPFALDWIANGFIWDEIMCRKDSDGDGKSNGEELGDPNCVWVQGAIPELPAQSHPGLCNPVGSCPNDSFYCGCHGHNCVG